MGFYIILFFIVGLLCFISVSVFDEGRGVITIERKINAKTGCFLLCMVAGLRSIRTGTDTRNYANFFLNTDISVFKNINIGENWVYNIWCYLVQRVSKNEYFFNFCCAVLIFSIVCYFINEYSENAALSLLLFMSFGCYFNTMNQTRQQMAAALLLLGFDFVMKKRLVGTILCCIAAVFIHNVAVFMIPVYAFLILVPKVTLKTVVISTGVCIGAGIMFWPLVVQFTKIFPYYQRYLVSSQITVGLSSVARMMDVVLYIVVQVALIYGLVRNRVEMLEYDEGAYYFGCLLGVMNALAIMAAFLTLSSAFMTRIKGILTYWTILSIPYVIKKFLGDNKLIYIIVALLSIIYMSRLGMKDGDGVIPYMFFLQD